MLITREREKLIQAVIFFVENTQSCGKTKLFKLLYFLDFEHFKHTGRNVTGLAYHAWKMGPVPVSLYDELDNPEPDFVSSIGISYIPTAKSPMLSLTPQAEFNSNIFSKRELKIMNSLAEEYRKTNADDMIEATHLENQPWDKVYNQEENRQQEIPYEYALKADEKEEMLSYISEREALVKAIR
jgi:uncharacterized phage-associated protein